MDLVDEENRVLLLQESIEDLLDALFEVSAIPRAGDERPEIEREDARAFQDVGNLALVDAQREAFGQRGLSDAGFANQQRVVLATPAQHLHHPLDFKCSSNQRIDLSRGSARNEIGRVRLQRICRRRTRLARRGVGRLALRSMRQHAKQEQTLDALRAQEVRSVTVFLLKQEHEQASALDVLRARRDGVHHRLLNDAVESQRRLRLDDGRCGDRSERLGEDIGQLATEYVQLGTTRREHTPRLWLVGDGQQQVLEPNLFVSTVGGDAEGALDGFQRLGRKRHGCLTHVLVLRPAPSLRAGEIPVPLPSAESF